MLSCNLESLCRRESRERDSAADLLGRIRASTRSFENHAIIVFVEDLGVDEPATIVVSCEHRGDRERLEVRAEHVVCEFCE